MSTAVMCPTCGAVAADAARACSRCGTPLAFELEPTQLSPVDPLRGVKLGAYLVEERIGIGGMGIVYRAMQPLVGTAVAIKVLRPDIIADEKDLQRFLGEAKAINQVRHRGIVTVFGAGDTPDGRKYLVMELLEGESLADRLDRDGRMLPADALPILEEVLAALSAVHAAGVVHRDLKPANVFLVKQPDGVPYPKLLDFGLARRSNNSEVSRIAGTPDYISPEHSRGRPPGPPADLYSFGVMAFRMLTGRLPFVGKTATEVMEQHVAAPPPYAGMVDPDVPPALSELIIALMAKEPIDRPSVAGVRLQLQAAAEQLRSAGTQQVVVVRDTTPMPAQTDPLSSTDSLKGIHLDSTPANPLGAVGPVPETSPSLSMARRRPWWPLALAGSVMVVLLGLAVSTLGPAPGSYAVEQPNTKMQPPPRPLVIDVPPDDEAVAETEAAPVPAVTPVPPPAPPPPPPAVKQTEPRKRPMRELKGELRGRLERVQKKAKERDLDPQLAAANRYLVRLEGAGKVELRELETLTTTLEQKVNAVK